MSTPASGDRVAFFGLGNMGAPMALRLREAGFAVVGYDVSEATRDKAAAAGLETATSPAQAVAGASRVVLMLPNSDIVEKAVAEAVPSLAEGAIVVDMSSSDPMRTRALAEELEESGHALVDAPVSGGVKGAVAGTLTIMVGGDADAVEAVQPLLAPLGRARAVGASGAGHALKALNNLLSGVHMLASAEALEAGRRFGLSYDAMLDVINASSGKSWSTEFKYPTYVVPETFDAGFSAALLVKDMHIAVELCKALGLPSQVGGAATTLWDEALTAMPQGADHTEIARYTRDKQDVRESND